MAAVSVGSLPPGERAGLPRLLRTIFQPHDTTIGNGSRQLQAELLMAQSVRGESKEDTCETEADGRPEEAETNGRCCQKMILDIRRRRRATDVSMSLRQGPLF